MAATIGPLVQRSRTQWLFAVGLHMATAIATAGAFGLSLATIGRTFPSELESWRVPGLLASGVLAALIDTSIVSVPLPHTMRSVPQKWWIDWGPLRASAAYGAVLGLGVTTVVPYASFYFLLIATVLIGQPIAGLVTFGAYGLGRSLPVILAGLLYATRDGVDTLLYRLLLKRSALRIGVGFSTACVLLILVVGLATR